MTVYLSTVFKGIFKIRYKKTALAAFAASAVIEF